MHLTVLVQFEISGSILAMVLGTEMSQSTLH